MSDVTPDVRLFIADRIHAGWTDVRVTLSMERISGRFDLAVTERYPGHPEKRTIRPGDQCRVEVRGKTVITGHVDEIDASYDATDHRFSVTGRDATGDLVDCSALHKSGQWKAQTLLQIATDLARPFGVRVTAETDVGDAFPSFAIQEGESAFECLDRAARMRGLLLVADGLGGLAITRAGSQRISTVLEQGKNILSADLWMSWAARFSTYRAKGQSPGTDDTTPQQNASPAAEVADPGIDRYRPLVLCAEHSGDPAVLLRRATWERNVRAGRGTRAVVAVQGWHHADGLWQPNRLVRLISPEINADGTLIIAEVTFELDDRGTRTTLMLTEPQAFSPEPLKTKKGKKTMETPFWERGN